MARLQILELPEGADDNRPPFVLVIDEAETGPDGLPVPGYRERRDIAELIGARTVLVFEGTVDIPANDLTLHHVQEAADGNVIRLRVEPDLEGFTETVMTEVAKAQAEVIAARQQGGLQ
ncbi:hypothetical protein [Streptomyces sp. NBC_01789]|uniref:hypothetical protein n=1 Tax=Streptomyces sp. NBC_01789 TaxID=2975941 RepID=UPI00224CBAB9|nr:hypothetical protein [Streptomyces sp. NBC_01789]MCX4450698.1 hypothetical protein [Streptomyces sp. NBC_01789]